MIKNVPPSQYNKAYFEGRYQNIDYTKLKEVNGFDHIYQKAGSMLELDESDEVVDLGCGTGQLAFYLYLKYKCHIAGIDYSPDAIYFCHKNASVLNCFQEYADLGKKVNFLQADNNNLPNFKNIQAVFLVDVLEHLYDEEINLVMDKIKKWRTKEGIYVIIHTDNNNYLRFIRPLTDWLLIIFGKSTLEEIKKGKSEVAKGHINLTTARKLKRKLISQGFKVLEARYPNIDMDITRAQLGAIGKIKPILYVAYYLGKLLYFLRPSFYLLAKY